LGKPRSDKKKKIPVPEKLKNQKLRKYVNKCVEFKFAGVDMRLLLSHALFSSFEVDDGTVLLLKTIAQRIEFDGISNVKDIGSGVGVIGIALKKKYPNLDLTFTDRDALALDFTAENCNMNGIKDFSLRNELGIENAGEKFDFIVSNIPAKIGDNAFKDLVQRSVVSLTERGICSVVIIKPFAETIKNAILDNDGSIVYEESTSRHAVFHFKALKPGLNCDSDFFAAFRRGAHSFKYGDHSYTLNTVYNLPDFDVMGYTSQIVLNMSNDLDIAGTCLFWNPVHGHIPVNIAKRFGGKIDKIILGSRDLLQLMITKENLLKQNYDMNKVVCEHVPFVSDTKTKADNIFILPDVTPFSPWETDLREDLNDLISDNGNIVIAEENSNINRILDGNKLLKFVRKEKIRGFSCLLMQKR
jgi:hypothetical protein